jgi:hypothetical protein
MRWSARIDAIDKSVNRAPDLSPTTRSFARLIDLPMVGGMTCDTCDQNPSLQATHHEGAARYISGPAGGVTVTCPIGHLVTQVARWNWAGSLWEMRAGEAMAGRAYVVTCHGALPAGEVY